MSSSDPTSGAGGASGAASLPPGVTPEEAMAMMGAIPPPPGVTPNFDTPDSHTPALIAVNVVFITLATLFLALRLYTRRFITRSVGVDDYVAVLTWVLAIAFSGLILGGIRYGFGVHLYDIHALTVLTTFKILYASQNLYLVLAPTLKLTFFFFFLRIFGQDRRMRYLTYGGMATVSVFYFIVFWYSLFQCQPIAKGWNPLLPGWCPPEAGLPEATGAFNIVSDFYIWIIPLPVVWNLHMNAHKKIKLLTVFSIGLFACIASILRLAFTVQSISDPDFTWNFANIGIWTVIEVYVGLMCACFAALPAFFEKHNPRALISYWSRLTTYLSSRRSTHHTSEKPSSAGSSTVRGGDSPGRKPSDGHDSQRHLYPAPTHTATAHTAKGSSRWGGSTQGGTDSQASRGGGGLMSKLAKNKQSFFFSQAQDEDATLRSHIESQPRRDDVEAWAGSEGIMRTVDLEQQRPAPTLCARCRGEV